MNKTFDTVDFKVAEAEFFLRKMTEIKLEFDDFRFYFSAFLASARTVTLALQQFKDIDGFDTWYEPHQNRLKEDRRAKFFLDARNSHLHGGSYPIRGASHVGGKSTYHFRDPEFDEKVLGNDDVVDQSRRFFFHLISIVYNCYVALGPEIDPHQYYTKEHFRKMGYLIEDAECEIFGWTNEKIEGVRSTKEERWAYLRSKVEGCQINHLFKGYLGKVTPQPRVPEHWEDFDYTDEEKGWVHLPAGFESIDKWIEYISLDSGVSK